MVIIANKGMRPISSAMAAVSSSRGQDPHQRACQLNCCAPEKNLVIGINPSEGKRSYGGKLIAYSPGNDLALIELKTAICPSAPLCRWRYRQPACGRHRAIQRQSTARRALISMK